VANFGQRMAALRRRKKKKGRKGRSKRARAPKLSKRVSRSASAAKRPNKRARKARKGGRARDVGNRLRRLETRMDTAEKNIGGIAVWARGMSTAVAALYRRDGHSVPAGVHARRLPSGR
jgi:hypothetical protein